MSRIKSISFSSVEKNEGCMCDRCGQYIRNIWTVKFDDGITMNYGIDCFAKLRDTAKLSTYGKKVLKDAMKRLEGINELTEIIKNRKAEDDYSYQEAQNNKISPWYQVDYEEYRKWWLNEVIPERIAGVQKEIDKFKNVNFTR